MSEEKVKDDLYQRVEEHLQALLAPELPDARLSPEECLELLEQARSSESCRELLETYEKTTSLVSALPDKPVPVDFGAKVGETIEADTPVVPFYKTELFQRMLGAAGAIALLAMVFWDAFTSPVEESPLQLADNVARPGAARENLAEELPVSPVAVEIAKRAEADRDAVEGVEGVHGKGSNADEKPRAGKFLDLLITHHMADILAEETFDALVEFLDAVDVFLHHAVSSIGLSRFWCEGADAFVDFVVP